MNVLTQANNTFNTPQATVHELARGAVSFPSVAEGITRLLPDLKRRAILLTRNPAQAEDLLQDAVERALRFRASFRPGGQLRAWLLRIMRNVFISQKRRLATERRIMESAGMDPNGWATLRPCRLMAGLSPPMEEALEGLPERLRSVIKMVDLQDASYRDAAEYQDVPIGTIMSRLHRGRARLAERLGAQEAA